MHPNFKPMAEDWYGHSYRKGQYLTYMKYLFMNLAYAQHGYILKKYEIFDEVPADWEFDTRLAIDLLKGQYPQYSKKYKNDDIFKFDWENKDTRRKEILEECKKQNIMQ